MTKRHKIGLGLTGMMALVCALFVMFGLAGSGLAQTAPYIVA